MLMQSKNTWADRCKELQHKHYRLVQMRYQTESGVLKELQFVVNKHGCLKTLSCSGLGLPSLPCLVGLALAAEPRAVCATSRPAARRTEASGRARYRSQIIETN